ATYRFDDWTSADHNQWRVAMLARHNVAAGIVAASLWLLMSGPALAATFVYISNSEDGDIGMYTLNSDGSLQPGQRFRAEKIVMPMTISPDNRFLNTAVRTETISCNSYSNE